MKEENVFWVGTQPLQEKSQPSLADDETFVAGIRGVFESSGYPVTQFVSALGPYGTWLVVFQRSEQEERVLWNGKTEQLILQIPLPAGGWEDRIVTEGLSQDFDGFVAGIEEILNQCAAD